MSKGRGHEEGEVNPAATWNPSDASGLMAVPESVAARPAVAIEPFFRAEYSRVWRWVQRMGVDLPGDAPGLLELLPRTRPSGRAQPRHRVGSLPEHLR